MYANEAVCPFHILDHTVLVVISFYVVELHAPIFIKYLVISFGTFFITMLIYELVIRRNNVIRFVFGLKPKRKKFQVLESNKNPLVIRSIPLPVHTNLSSEQNNKH